MKQLDSDSKACCTTDHSCSNTKEPIIIIDTSTIQEWLDWYDLKQWDSSCTGLFDSSINRDELFTALIKAIKALSSISEPLELIVKSKVLASGAIDDETLAFTDPKAIKEFCDISAKIARHLLAMLESTPFFEHAAKYEYRAILPSQALVLSVKPELSRTDP